MAVSPSQCQTDTRPTSWGTSVRVISGEKKKKKKKEGDDDDDDCYDDDEDEMILD